MRLIALLLASLIVSGSAMAQEWKEYAYPDDAFTVAFPAEPKLEIMTYQAADGRAVDARLYSLAQESGVFRMMVADLPDPATQESAVIDHAIKGLS